MRVMHQPYSEIRHWGLNYMDRMIQLHNKIMHPEKDDELPITEDLINDEPTFIPTQAQIKKMVGL